MLRRTVADRPDAAAPDDDEQGTARPLTLTGLAPPAPAAAPATGHWTPRLRAAGLHLLVCAGAGVLVFALVFGLWYPGPLPSLLGVGAILGIVLAVDIVVGPLLTLLVYDRSKPRLKWDLAMIGVLQAAALGYGLHTLHQGRPAFIVLVADRFEVTSPADLRPADREAARDNPDARIDPMRPRWVAAQQPDSVEEQGRIVQEALTTGRDIQHHPRHYVDYRSAARTGLERALPMARLRTLNPGRGAEIDALIADSGRAESALRYLPLRGPAADGAVLIDANDASVVAMAALVPW